MGDFAPKTDCTSYTPQEVRQTCLIILSANNARQTDTALPTTADISRPQTQEAGGTRQPAESASRTPSSTHSATTESMGTDTGDLRHRVTTRPAQSLRPAKAKEGPSLGWFKKLREEDRGASVDIEAVVRRKEIFLDGKFSTPPWRQI